MAWWPASDEELNAPRTNEYEYVKQVLDFGWHNTSSPGVNMRLELAFAEGRPRDVWRRLRFVVDQARAWTDATGGDVRGYLSWIGHQTEEGARVSEAILPETDDDAVREERLEAFDDADGIVESARLLEVVSPPIGVVFALFPLLITGTAVASLTKVTRGRTLLYSTFIGALYVMFTGMIAFFVVGAGLLAFAAYKSRKADVAALAAEGA